MAAVTSRVARTGVTPEELEHVLVDEQAILLLATRAGSPAGTGVGRPSSVPGSLYAMVRVLPDQRRSGVGTRLLEALREHARGLGLTALWGRIDERDAGALLFARRHGFDETGREYEAVLDLAQTASASEAPPPGVELVSLADRPDLAGAAHELERATLGDIPVAERLESGSFARWRAENLEGPDALPDACLVALEGDDVIGYAGLTAVGADEETVEHLLTAVRRDRRRRGIATALKRAQIEWARERGYRRLVTSNDEPNAAIRAVNERLGYRSEPVSILVRGPV